jgi:hypothetical protein
MAGFIAEPPEDEIQGSLSRGGVTAGGVVRSAPARKPEAPVRPKPAPKAAPPVRTEKFQPSVPASQIFPVVKTPIRTVGVLPREVMQSKQPRVDDSVDDSLPRRPIPARSGIPPSTTISTGTVTPPGRTGTIDRLPVLVANPSGGVPIFPEGARGSSPINTEVDIVPAAQPASPRGEPRGKKAPTEKIAPSVAPQNRPENVLSLLGLFVLLIGFYWWVNR